MNFAVTGGAGFIGSHLVKYLIEQGHNVIVVDNIQNDQPDNLKEVQNKIQFFQLDILDYRELRDTIKNTDGVFHNAAITDVQESFSKQKLYNDVNVVGTKNIFKIANEFGFKVVFASSASVYGDSKLIPIKEDFDRNPQNPYGKTKLQAEVLAEKYSKLGVKIIGLRYFNVYGFGQSLSYAGVITKFLENLKNNKPPIIYGDGLQVRDFVFVEDVVRANLLAMESKLDFSIINIGSGKDVSILNLANMMIKSFRLNIKPIFAEELKNDVKSSQADIKKAEKLLNWKPQTKLQDWLNIVVGK